MHLLHSGIDERLDCASAALPLDWYMLEQSGDNRKTSET